MREIFAKSLQDGTMIEMGRDTSPICEIMEIGKYTGELQYETQMTGAQLVEFIKEAFLLLEVIITESISKFFK